MFQTTLDVNTLPDYQSPLQILQSLKYEFVLTGSRRFGDASPTSDYDFFVHDDGYVSEVLMDKGFRKVSNDEGYSDIPDTTVFRKHNVDVQVRKDADKFEKICQWLEQNPGSYKYMKSLVREERKKIWTFLRTVV